MEDSKELHSASLGSRVPGCHPTAWLQVLELPRQTWTERDQLRWWVWVPTASRCPPAADAETSAGIPHPLCCRRRTPLPHWEGVQQSGWAGAMCCRQSKNTHQVQKARGSPRAVLCTGCAVPTPPSASGSRPLPAALWLVSCCARRLRQPATRSLVTCCGDATDHTPNLTARSNQWCRQCFGLFMRTHYAAKETRHLTHITHTETNTKMTHFKHSFQKTKFNLNRRKNKSN